MDKVKYMKGFSTNQICMNKPFEMKIVSISKECIVVDKKLDPDFKKGTKCNIKQVFSGHYALDNLHGVIIALPFWDLNKIKINQNKNEKI